MALVIVLAVVVLIAAVAVSLSVAMRTERTSVGHFSSGVEADVLSHEGVEAARAAVLDATKPGRLWSAGPGWIKSWPINDPNTVQTSLLHSGPPGGTPDTAFDLNRVVLSADERTAMTGNKTASEMNVAWIYVNNDGTRTAAPTTDAIGRYAFWADNESSRINLNTAWQRLGNTNSSSSPSKIALEAIPGITSFDGQQIFDTAAKNPFASPDEARRLNSGLATILSENRFLTTHAAWSDDLNASGEAKIVLTTRAELADARPYLNVLGTNIVKTVNDLATKLNRKHPYTTSTDGYGKKFGNDPKFSAALAVDIIDYVRSSESTESVVIPTRGSIDGSGTFTTADTFGSNALIGMTRRPVITEIGMWMGPVQGPDFEGRLLVEIHSPEDFNLPPIALGEFDIDMSITGKTAPTGTGYKLDPSTTGVKILYPPGATELKRGDYVVVELLFRSNAQRSPRTDFPLRVPLRWKNNAISIAPLNLTGLQMRVPINDVSEPYNPTSVRSVEISDPRVGSHSTDWVRRADGNTFGSRNSIWESGQIEVSNPPRDGVGAEASLRMPAQRGSGNPFGAVQSVAELGVVSTGRFGTNQVGVPWRTIRLRPTSGSSASTLPDWVITDLFVAPIVTPTGDSPSPELLARYRPRPLTTAGRININSPIQPFTTLLRPEPLRSLLTGISGLNVESTMASLQARTKAADGFLLVPDALFSPGELTQIEGLGATNEAGELLMRQVLDLATTRGNTFRVYSTAQSIKVPTGGGPTVIQAERSVMAILERDGDSCRIIHWANIPF